MMVWVCPPQISISTQGRVVDWTISAAKARAMRWSLYSSRYFINGNPTETQQRRVRVSCRWVVENVSRVLRFRRRQFCRQRSHFFQKLIRALGFFRVDPADSKADVNHHVVSQTSLWHKVQGYLAHDSAELHASRPQRAEFLNFENLTGYGYAHSNSP